jgi:hypothetical protein
LKIPIFNPKEKPTYYGALNLFLQEFILSSYQTANEELTVDWLKNLQVRNPQAII